MRWPNRRKPSASGARKSSLAEGEYQASTRLAEAADIMGKHPMTLQLRYLQTLTEIAVENNSTVVFPLPMDLLKPFLELQERLDEV